MTKPTMYTKSIGLIFGTRPTSSRLSFTMCACFFSETDNKISHNKCIMSKLHTFPQQRDFSLRRKMSPQSKSINQQNKISHVRLRPSQTTYTIKNSIKLQFLNWQLGLQLNYCKITIFSIINVELQTFVGMTLLYYHFYHVYTTKPNYTLFYHIFII